MLFFGDSLPDRSFDFFFLILNGELNVLLRAFKASFAFNSFCALLDSFARCTGELLGDENAPAAAPACFLRTPCTGEYICVPVPSYSFTAASDVTSDNADAAARVSEKTEQRQIMPILQEELLLQLL